ncbi:MAG: dynamin family protein [Paracoccaceae bacterium]
MAASITELSDLKAFLSASESHRDADGDKLVSLREKSETMLKALRRPVRVLIAGEFSSGKSTLANILVGDQLIPSAKVSDNIPPLVFRYGDTIGSAAGWWNKKIRAKYDYIDFVELTAQNPDFIVIQSPNPLLKQINVFDVAGTTGPAGDNKLLLQMQKRADLFIWCTNAVQAWNVKEKASWSKLAPINPNRAILAVTHIDLPAIQHGYDRVISRLQDDAGDHFGSILPIAGPRALEAATNGIVQDSKAWSSSGGEAMIARLLVVENSIRLNDAERARKFIDRHLAPYLTVAAQPPLDAANAALRVDIAPVSENLSCSPILASWQQKIDALLVIAEDTEDITESNFLQASCDALMEIADELAEPGILDDETFWLLDQFRDAVDLLMLLQLEDGDEPIERAAAVLLQVGRDLSWVAAGAGR